MKIDHKKFNRIADLIGYAISNLTATLFIVFSIHNAVRALFEGKNLIAFMFIIIFCLSIKLLTLLRQEAKDKDSDEQE